MNVRQATVREHARHGGELGAADAQALERALTQVELERDRLLAVVQAFQACPQCGTYRYHRHAVEPDPRIEPRVSPVPDDPRFGVTDYVVEATRFELESLRERHRARCDWGHEGQGLVLTVGQLAGMPVCVELEWVRLGRRGVRVACYRACGELSDRRQTDAWRDRAFAHLCVRPDRRPVLEHFDVIVADALSAHPLHQEIPWQGPS